MDKFTAEMRGVNRLLNQVLTKILRYRDIAKGTKDHESLYLRRFYIKKWGKRRLFLHYFARGDDDRHLHTHPWNFRTFILNKGYHEELKNGKKYFRPALTLFPKRPSTWAHKVHLTNGPCWTMFMPGKKCRTWGFLTEKGEIPFYEYLDNEGAIDDY